MTIFGQAAGSRGTLVHLYSLSRVSLFEPAGVLHPACLSGTGPFASEEGQFYAGSGLAVALLVAVLGHWCIVAKRRGQQHSLSLANPSGQPSAALPSSGKRGDTGEGEAIVRDRHQDLGDKPQAALVAQVDAVGASAVLEDHDGSVWVGPGEDGASAGSFTSGAQCEQHTSGDEKEWMGQEGLLAGHSSQWSEVGHGGW